MSRIDIKFERMSLPGGRARLQAQAALDGGILAISVVEQEQETILNLQGVVGDEFEGLTASNLAPVVQAIKTPIRLRINTPGGLVSQAVDMFDAIANHPEQVTADIVGEAWSAGTILSAAADVTRIDPMSVYGIHQPWGGMVLMGNAGEIRAQLPLVDQNLAKLDALSDQLVEVLAARTSASAEDIREWMIGQEGMDGTEFIGQAAVDAGLVDELIETPKRAPQAKKDFTKKQQLNAIALMKARRYQRLTDIN